MGKLLIAFVGLTVLFAMPAIAEPNPTPGLQVVECTEDPAGSGNWTYWFYACTGEFDANDLHIGLTAAEIAEGTQVLDCSVPDLPGFGCSSTATTADYVFPVVGPYTCVPGIAGQYFDVSLHTMDGLTVVIETWTMDGAPIASFTTLIACPPTGTEASTWGRVKTLFR